MAILLSPAAGSSFFSLLTERPDEGIRRFPLSGTVSVSLQREIACHFLYATGLPRPEYTPFYNFF